MRTLASSPQDWQIGWAWESARAQYWRARHQITEAEKAEAMASLYRHNLAEIGVEMPGI